MAKVTGPLLSFGARGQVGKTIVFSGWKGLKTAREYVVPSNPQTAAQSTQRGYMTQAVDAWHDDGDGAPDADDKAAWNRYAGVLGPMSGFNAFCRAWIDERVAGGDPSAVLWDETPGARTANSFGDVITLRGGTTEDVNIHIGNSLTFFGVEDTVSASSGVATFSTIDTGFAAGTRVYYYFDSGTPGSDYSRTGIYTAVLS